MTYIYIRPHRRWEPLRKVRSQEFHKAVLALVEVAGIAAHKARNLIRWRIAAGLSMHFDRVLEPNGSITVLGGGR